MNPPLLTAKLFTPLPGPNLVPRPRLIEKLDAGLSSKLILISAPAGFGKTTLLSAWAQQSQARTHIAWLSLDAGDNDLARFLTYFVTALQSIDSSLGQGVLAALQSPGALNIEVVLTALLNEFTGYTEDVVLILDDYHLIESQLVDQAIVFMLEHLPPRIHLVIASRINPSLPLSLLRGRGQMCEIRVRDLRFTPEEAAQFLNQVVDIDLSAGEVAALETRTEGWIAGLQLAALSMQNSDDVHGFVHSFSGSDRYILDFLGEEVFSRQPQNVQDFLLQTSILDRMRGSLCNALTGSSDGEEMLVNLERGNLFVVPLDNERRWYRYHHLFADWLRQRLHQMQPERVPALHRRASEWHAQHDSQFDAVQHALTGSDYERAADLIEANALRLIGQGVFTPVQKWIHALPGSVVRARPYLCVYDAWVSNFTHQLEAIEPRLQDAQRALQAMQPPAGDDMARDLHGHIATLRAWNARRQHDNALAITLLEDAADCLEDDNSFVCTFAKLNLGLSYMESGELVQAASALHEAVSWGLTSENELASLIATGQLAAVFILQGRLHEAARLCRRTIQDQLSRSKKPPPTLCMVYLRLGVVLAEWNDLDGFYANLSQAVILADQIGYDSLVTAGSKCMEWERQLLEEQGIVIEFSEDVAGIINRVMAVEAVPAETGTVPDTVNSMSNLNNNFIDTYLADDAYFEIWPGFSEHARAWSLANQGSIDEALDLLDRIRESAQAVEGIGLMIEARSSEALLSLSQNNMQRAMAALEDALSLSKAEGYMRTYLDRGEPMAQLLREAAARGIRPDYVSRLLTAFGPGKSAEPTLSSQPLAEALSRRELEVLQLIADGLSNRQISERLFLSLSTVKGHNRNIFGKLGVERRTEAVARARELGLVS